MVQNPSDRVTLHSINVNAVTVTLLLWGRTRELCVTVGLVTRTADILAY